MSEGTVIHWFRRDLRLRDNLALHAAIMSGRRVLPLFILDDHILQSARFSPHRMRFLLAALQSLNDSLHQFGSQLVVQRGNPREILPRIVQSVQASAVYANRDYTPYSIQRDRVVEQSLQVPLHLHDDALLLPPGTVLKANGEPYVVFTPFKQNWNAQEKPRVSDTPLTNRSFTIQNEHSTSAMLNPAELGCETAPLLAPASEEAAQMFLREFVTNDLRFYDERRNMLPIAPYRGARPQGTSYLSPYLRLGLLSPRQAYWAARDAYTQTSNQNHQKAIATWVSELTWREFYAHILVHFPHVLTRDFVPTYARLEWLNSPQELEAWQNGQTGYPIIDAPMRQLKAIGWMPNRARMIVASFLTKDLLIHWREGEAHFMRYLIDGDPASNNGGWQWAAGTGTDAQPYFRIFNPVSQSRQYASSEYLRYWLPELADVPDDKIHAPWEMKQAPKNYPPPIVNHGLARGRALEAFKRARSNS